MGKSTFAVLLLAIFSVGAARAQNEVDVRNESYYKTPSIYVSAEDANFGDSSGLSSGAIAFEAVDVSIPGNNALPVEFRRRLEITNNYNQWSGVYGSTLAAGWDIDIPHIAGTYAASGGWITWDAARPYKTCSISDPTYMLPPTSGYIAVHNFWSPPKLIMPGGVQHMLLHQQSLVPSPTSGGSYYWVTSSQHYVSCISTLKNAGGSTPWEIAAGSGEGFKVISGDGITYTFDWMSGGPSTVFRTIKPDGTSFSLGAVRFAIYPTLIEDRFGNWVKYTYSNTSREKIKLLKIESSDGRLINVSYTADELTSVTANGKTWAYTKSVISPSEVIFSVLRPDGSAWGYTWKTNSSLPSNKQRNYRLDTCEPYSLWFNEENVDFSSSGAPLPYITYKVKNPSGGEAEFGIHQAMLRRSGTPKQCFVAGYIAHAPGDMYPINQAIVPAATVGYSLGYKKVYGAGVPEKRWYYNYTSQVASGSIEGVSITTVTNPDGSTDMYKFGNVYQGNEGLLLRKERKSGSTVLEGNSYTYEISGPTFPKKVGHDGSLRGEGYVNTYLRPLKSSVVSVSGINFSDILSGHDAWGRPSTSNQASTLSGSPSRIVATEYHDDLSKWVLGQVKKTTSNGLVTSETTYTTNAQPLVIKSMGHIKETRTYNTDGTIATSKDGNNKTTTFSSWKRGIPQSIKYPATPEAPTGATQSAVVNDSGWITSVTNEEGKTTGYAYDAMGRLSGVTYPTGDTPASSPTSITFEPVASAEYGIPAGHWRQTISTGNARKITYFDGLWRSLVVREYDTANQAGTQRFQRFAYDHEGRVTFASYPGTTDALTTGTTTTYDALGRVTKVSQSSELGALDTTTVYQTGFKTQVTDPKGNITTTSYLAYDQPTYDWPTTITHPQGITEIARDSYGLGKPTKITRRNTASTKKIERHFVYGGLNMRLCKIVEPETGASMFAYDEVGNLLWSTSGSNLLSTADCTDRPLVPENQKVYRAYDGRNRLTTLSFPDGKGDQDWLYTKDGLPSQVTTYNDATNTVINSYTYNNRRLMTGEAQNQTGGSPWSIGYGYSANGHLSSLVYPAGLTVDYAPNALGQPTKAGTFATGVSYFPNGAIKQFTYGNGVIHTMTQNARQLPSRSTDNGGVLDLGYTYDKNANVTAITDYTTGARQTRGMTYDTMDRLLQTTSSMFGTATYTYDVLDNLNTVKVAAGPQVRDHTYVYDTNNRLTNVTNTVGGASVIGLGYDVRGNLANRNGQAYQFDFGNRLRSAQGGLETYRYDAHGRRVLSSYGGAIFSVYSDQGQLLFQRDERTSKRLQYVYLGGSQIATRERPVGDGPEVITYQHTDALGSPIADTNPSKVKVQTSEYEPYGKLLNRSNDNRPGYTGHVMDAATGMTYMQQRYYDPAIGAFLSADPVTAYSNPVGSFHRYRYGANNPYKFTDPDGREIRIESDSAYAAAVRMWLSKMSTANPELARRVGIMQDSQYVHRIVPASRNPNGSNGPANVGEGGTVADEGPNGQGTGSVTYFDPNQILEINGVVSGPGEILSHELTGHGYDKDQGVIDRSINPQTGQKRSEESAIGVEQLYRQGTKNPVPPPPPILPGDRD